MNIRKWFSAFWRWIRPIGPWLEREVYPVAKDAIVLIARVNVEHPGWSDDQKREWVVGELKKDMTSRGVSISMTVILTAIQLAYARYTKRE